MQRIVARTEPERPAKNLAAVALGKLGGLKGGKARAAKLTAEQRRELAKKGRARDGESARAPKGESYH